MTFQATPPEVFSALQEAGRRSGLQFLSGDVQTGTAVFTSGRFLLGFGEKVTAFIKQVAPGTVEVRLTSSRGGARAGRLATELSGLLPRIA
jgi:hypothetical protein